PKPKQVGFSSFLLNSPDIIGGRLKTVYNTLAGKIQNVPGANGTEPPFAFAGAFVIQTATNNVQATVGSQAVLQSGQDVNVDATLTQKASDSTAAALSVPQGADQSDTSLALTVQLFSPTVEATVDNSAQIDAFGTVAVAATLNEPFLFPTQFVTPDFSSLTAFG